MPTGPKPTTTTSARTALSTSMLQSPTTPTLSTQTKITQARLASTESIPTAFPPPSLAAVAVAATQTITTTGPTPETNNESHIILVLRSTSKTTLTSELTKMLTKIAFQQWKITIQDKIIKEAQLNITQATAAITKQRTPTASVSTASATTRKITSPSVSIF